MISYLLAILLFWSCALVSKTYKYLPILFRWIFAQQLLFCIGNFDHFSLWTDLILPHMLGLVLFLYFWSMFLLFFIKKKKKKLGKRCRFLFFLLNSFAEIVCIFAWYLSSLCIDWLCLDMIESLCLIKFSCAS
jgi:hypothetical protein